MTTSEMAQQGFSMSESAMVRKLINRTLIVEWGTVKEVLGDGSIVNVLLSVTERAENTTVVTCVLISPCSDSMAFNLMPKVGDKALVLSPRHFNQAMFDVSTAEQDDTEVILDKNSQGYNKVTCLAILYNQFRDDVHKNFIDFNNGLLSVGLAYSKDDDKNKLTLNTTADGEVTLVSNDVTETINKDNEISITTGKATVTIDKNGNVTIDAEGKYTIKNNSTDLKQVVDGLATELENLTTIGSPATQATSPASKTTIGTWRTSKLNQLFS